MYGELEVSANRCAHPAATIAMFAECGMRWPASCHFRPGRAPCRGPEQRLCTRAEPLARVRRTVRGARRRQLLATNNTVIPTVIFMGNNDYCEILGNDFVDVMYWCAAARSSTLGGSRHLDNSV